MRQFKRLRNIFADKASFIARRMLSEQSRKWVIRDFVGESGVSIGMAHGVLEAMHKKGYIERPKRGPDSYARLIHAQDLIDQWVAEYRFEYNEIDTYYSPDKNILSKLKRYLKNKPYALTFHSGANLTTSYVNYDQIHLYFDPADWKNELLDLRQQLDLKELVRGGNIHIVRPYYKKSVFYGVQTIKGYKVVSNLQLYLDLYNYHPRGQQHAEYLKKTLEEEGKNPYGS
jgi:hypothetical protein